MYRVLNKTDLLYMLCMINQLLKYSRNCSATKLDIGDTIANLLIYKFQFYV